MSGVSPDIFGVEKKVFSEFYNAKERGMCYNDTYLYRKKNFGQYLRKAKPDE